MGHTPDAKHRLLSMGFRGIRGALRAANMAAAFADGFALGVLSEEARTRLSVEFYSSEWTAPSADLFDWERRWFEEKLPSAPAKILVGGAGTGREVRCLEAQGYAVVGFDPMVSGSDQEAGLIGASYEDLVEARSQAALRIQREGPYDAILLGWGSYTHVSSASARAALLVRLRELSSGPVLLSYWATVARPGRAKRAGYRASRVFGSSAAVDLAADSVRPHCGYTHGFTREELTGLASDAGYRIEFGAFGSYPHATLFVGSDASNIADA